MKCNDKAPILIAQIFDEENIYGVPSYEERQGKKALESKHYLHSNIEYKGVDQGNIVAGPSLGGFTWREKQLLLQFTQKWGPLLPCLQSFRTA